MGKDYIRRPVVFNPGSERELRIWNWIVTSTDSFKGQNFAAFVRDKLEWCMLHENKGAEPVMMVQPQITEDLHTKKGYSDLL